MKGSIATRYLKTILPILLLLFTVVIVGAYTTYQNKSMEDSKTHVNQVLDLVNNNLRNWVDTQVLLAQNLASNTDVIEACKNPWDTSAVAKASTFLNMSFKQYSYQENFPLVVKLPADQKVVINDKGKDIEVTDGHYIADTVDGKTLGKAGTQMSFVKGIYEGKPSFVSEVYPSILRGNPIFVVSAPVKDGNNLVGATVVAPQMDYFTQKFVDTVKVGKTGSLYLIDSNNSIIAHPDKTKILNAEASESIKAVVDKIKAGETSFDYTSDQVTQTYTVRKFDTEGLNVNSQWYLVLVQDKAEITAEATKVLFLIVGVALLLFILIWLTISYLTNKIIVKPLNKIGASFEAVANGDLRDSVNLDEKDANLFRGELGVLSKGFNQMLQNLRQLITAVKSKSDVIEFAFKELSLASQQTTQATNTIANTSSQLANDAEKQADAVVNTKQAIENIANIANDIVVTSNNTCESTLEATKVAVDGRDALQKVVDQMNNINTTVQGSSNIIAELGKKSESIGKIVEVISSVAAQTNLLALNAAIEAARAGEHGRGFSVVADEIRKLAEQSSNATTEISKLIYEIQSQTNEAVSSMKNGSREVIEGRHTVDNARERFNAILEMVTKVDTQVKDISVAINNMSTHSGSILNQANNMKEFALESASSAEELLGATQEQTSTVEDMANSINNLAESSEELSNLIKKFDI